MSLFSFRPLPDSVSRRNSPTKGIQYSCLLKSRLLLSPLPCVLLTSFPMLDTELLIFPGADPSLCCFSSSQTVFLSHHRQKLSSAENYFIFQLLFRSQGLNPTFSTIPPAATLHHLGKGKGQTTKFPISNQNQGKVRQPQRTPGEN